MVPGLDQTPDSGFCSSRTEEEQAMARTPSTLWNEIECTYIPYSVETWYRGSRFKQLALLTDHSLAQLVFVEAVKRNPDFQVVLKQGAHILEDSERKPPFPIKL
jgi:hypothetical protein